MLNRKSAIGIATLGLFLSIGIVKTDIIANAATTGSVSSDVQGDNFMPRQYRDLDQLVVVHENRYEISDFGKFVLPKQTYIKLSEQLDSVNKDVCRKHAVIDPTTKSFVLNYQDRASNTPSTKNFWWGTRYYFRSNAQVDTMVSQLHTWANYNSMAAIAGGLLSPYIGAVCGLNTIRLNQVAVDLEAYNNKHKKQHIYMDLNTWIGTWSFGTF